MFSPGFLSSVVVLLLVVFNFPSGLSLATTIATPEDFVKADQKTDICVDNDRSQHPCPG